MRSALLFVTSHWHWWSLGFIVFSVLLFFRVVTSTFDAVIDLAVSSASKRQARPQTTDEKLINSFLSASEFIFGMLLLAATVARFFQ